MLRLCGQQFDDYCMLPYLPLYLLYSSLPLQSNKPQGASDEERLCVLASWISHSQGWLALKFKRRRNACACEVTSDPSWRIVSIAAIPQSAAVRGRRDGEKPGEEWIISRKRQTESIANLKKTKKDCYVNKLSGGTQSKATACICRTQTSPSISTRFWRWILKKCYSPLIASIGWCPIPSFFLFPLISRLFSALFSSLFPLSLLSSCSPPRVALSQTTSLCELVFATRFSLSATSAALGDMNSFDLTSKTWEHVIYIGLQQLIDDNW